MADNLTLNDDTASNDTSTKAADDYFAASQWSLIRFKFKKHRLAMAGLTILAVLYTLALFPGFFSVNTHNETHTDYILMPPQGIHFVDAAGNFSLRPFVYGVRQEIDDETWEKTYVRDEAVRHPIRFFPQRENENLWGALTLGRHLVGVEAPGVWFPFGTDEFGRCLFSRTIAASQISLFIGIAGVMLSFLIGSFMGGLSGYFGGTIDIAIQRLIEFVLSIPSIPLWMALAAAMPQEWSSTQVFFGITIVLSVVGWANLARVVRGKTLEIREADFVMAARLMGVPTMQIIRRHILPSFASYLIVSITLGVPAMIIAETALSFLQIGIKPPAVSWGVLLQAAQSPNALSQSPWLLIPGAFVVLTVICFNFVGDGLRDAVDPYR
ncbi:ABC transporter permease [Marinovum sp. 2_MG-2023]|uniref:ABC transporter permease n=1 Tax=Roseobacteraceae TaxID=2854170 RepID=UPI001FD26958|nr:MULTISPECIES: ABC transporter permease [unclassified Marinovum]MCJ7873168.1 ABC transporter permease [Phaeobacter sp. J2-8]MDO6728962.1 ABC transporter permease [Marinovum sp. 2_MG-2023]MDO6779411.1 ABC transporter permease [Marinovum sp. 1_MG-2023]